MTTLAIAHRAGNSLAGLHAANLLRADVIECDVHAHRGRLEVRHLKTAGPLPFLWDRWELASARAPRLGLAELLAADRRGSTFMLDLKGRRAATGRDVAALLHELAPGRHVLVCGRSWPSVDHVVDALPYAEAVLSARTPAERRLVVRRVTGGVRPPPYGVALHVSLLDEALVGTLLRHVRVVMTWPVNDWPALERVLDLGVNGVISDEPEVLRAVRDRP